MKKERRRNEEGTKKEQRNEAVFKKSWLPRNYPALLLSRDKGQVTIFHEPEVVLEVVEAAWIYLNT